MRRKRYNQKFVIPCFKVQADEEVLIIGECHGLYPLDYR
jgi:hypothetical protein